MLDKKSRMTVFDLFAGAGGLSLGFENVGFKLIGATDFDRWSCETLRANHPDAAIIEGDIKQLSVDKINKELKGQDVDVIIGGPPCQGFSQLGKRMRDDPRNEMLHEFWRIVTCLRPKVFVMENVPQLLKSDQFAEFQGLVEDSEYEISFEVLMAADFGAAQKRKRAIVIGSRIGRPFHPAPTHKDPAKISKLQQETVKPWRTVRDAIGDLPLKPTGENLHTGRNPTELSIKRYKHIPPGGNRFDLPRHLTINCWLNKTSGGTDLFGRLWWNRPSVTIRTEFFKPEKGRYLHPTEHRPITLREGARLQGFPDSYKFVGSNTQIAKQIGNAVPVPLAQLIANEIKALIAHEAGSLDEDKASLPSIALQEMVS
jgi:DNA (cytosine-5)-methyltransferase 1